MGELLLVFVEKGQHLLHGDHRPIDADALAEIDKMRRSEEPCLVAKFLEIRRQERRYGAFSVGSGHMHAAQFPLRVADDFQQFHDVFKPLFVCRAPDLVVHRVGGEDSL